MFRFLFLLAFSLMTIASAVVQSSSDQGQQIPQAQRQWVEQNRPESSVKESLKTKCAKGNRGFPQCLSISKSQNLPSPPSNPENSAKSF